MEKCDKPRGLFAHVRRLLPTIILVGLTALAGGTDVFSASVHQLVSQSLTTRFTEFLPYLLNMLMVATALNLAWVIYHPLTCWVTRLIGTWQIRDDLKSFLGKGFRLCYWALVLFGTICFFAPDLMGKLAVGATLITAAVALALQGLLNDFICGLLLQGSRALAEGDSIQVADVSIANGKVLEIGYVRTVVNNEDVGPVSVPNSKVWASALGKKKAKSRIIKPGDPEKQCT